MPKRSRAASEDISVDEAPTSINPYEVLSLPPSASPEDIKKAYRKAALKHHPDKAAPQDKEAAHTKFQEIAFAFAILSDERRRKRYDSTGRTEESLDLDDDDFNWSDFFREQFKEMVTVDKINDFASEYKGSEEEQRNVLNAYTKHKGDMRKLYQNVMLSDMLVDEEQYREWIDAAIESGEVEGFKKYLEESESAIKKRIAAERRNREKDQKEIEQQEEENKSKKNKTAGGGMGDLAALIQQRQKGRAENFFDNLEAKYAPKGGKKKKHGTGKQMDVEPPEEAFAANRQSKRAKK
jgi:DnaJ family protein C protein 9